MTSPFTHRDKVLWPKAKVTKGDLIDYYRQMAPRILPYLKDRPLTLVRHPNGVNKPGFFQKNFEPADLPPFATTKTIHAASTGKNVRYLVCNNKDTLLYAAQLAAVELHPWSARVSSLTRPDW